MIPKQNNEQPKLIDYIIVAGNSVPDLCTNVKKKIKEGFIPFGEVQFRSVLMYQAMIKYEEPSSIEVLPAKEFEGPFATVKIIPKKL